MITTLYDEPLTGVFPAILNVAVPAVGIEKFVTVFPSLSTCDFILYVTAPCAPVAAVNALS